MHTEKLAASREKFKNRPCPSLDCATLLGGLLKFPSIRNEGSIVRGYGCLTSTTSRNRWFVGQYVAQQGHEQPSGAASAPGTMGASPPFCARRPEFTLTQHE